MKNILNEYIETDFKGRLLFTVNYIDDSAIKDKIVLDVGCGFGWIIANALQRGAKKAVGIDISEDDLVTPRTNIKDKKAEFQVGSSSHIPYPDKYFDTVFSFEVLEHAPKGSERAFFEEIARVLKKGGVFYLSTPYSSLLSKCLDPAWWLIGHRHYSKAAVREYARKTGFQMSDLQVRGGFWNLTNALNMYFSKWILRRQPLFSRWFDERENEEFKHKNGLATLFIKVTKK